MISMVSLVNRDINLVSGIRKVNVNTMIGMVIRVNKMGTNVNRRNAKISMVSRVNKLLRNFNKVNTAVSKVSSVKELVSNVTICPCYDKYSYYEK